MEPDNIRQRFMRFPALLPQRAKAALVTRNFHPDDPISRQEATGGTSSGHWASQREEDMC